MGEAFHDTIASLCARELSAARKAGDAERVSGLVQTLASLLGKTIAMAAEGDPKTIDRLLIGAEGLVQEEAVGFGELAAMVRRTRGPR